ncbi:MAG: DsbA family protein [Beijerinckiaceae bacterium]|nr:DsbA family protein [Beijerinckiaceae bacterium]
MFLFDFAARLRVHGRTAALALALGFAGAASDARAQMSQTQRGEIETVIRDYLIKNPEVLRDALIELDRRAKAEEDTQRRQAVEQLGSKIFSSKHQVVVGNPKGTIDLVEFYDYNCGFCKRALNDLAALIKGNPDLRVILKEFPVLSPGSVEAAHVAGAAKMQLTPDRFWAFHQKLMSSRGQVGRAQALAVAKEFNVDMARLTKDMESEDVKAGIAETMQLGETLGINGTPSYVIGKDIVVGAVGLEALQTRIINVRKCGKGACD